MLEGLVQAIQRVQALSGDATYKEKLTTTFGVVLESEEPRYTGGTDLIQTIRVADESCPNGVPLCMFARAVDMLPRAQPGDVLELRDVIVQFWNDRPQLFAKMSRPHKFGFRLHRPAANNAYQQVQLYNAQADNEYAELRLRELRAMQAEGPAVATTDPASVYLRRVRDLSPPEEEGQRPPCVDMRVRVLAVDQRRADEEVILYVWDATDARPVPADLQLPPPEWKGAQLKVGNPRRHIMPLASQPPGLTVLQDLPSVGTALPVIMCPGAVPRTGLPQVGDWVKIKVVGVAAVEGQWQVVFGPVSRLTQSQPTQAFEPFYQARLANHDTCEWPSDLAQVVTSCSYTPALPHSTLRQLQLEAATGQLAGPFRVQVRLLGYLPEDLTQWCRLRAQQQQGQQGQGQGGGSGGVWEWAANLWLEDATGEVRALLLGQEGDKLLGMPAQCLSSNPAAVDELHSRLQQLTAVQQLDGEGGTWLDVALTPLLPARQQEHGQQQQQGDSSQQQSASQRQPSQQQEQQQQVVTGAAGAADAGHVDRQLVGPGGPSHGRQLMFVLHDAVLSGSEQGQLNTEQQQQEQSASPQGQMDMQETPPGQQADAEQQPPQQQRPSRKRRR